jgi:hypothetical protein
MGRRTGDGDGNHVVPPFWHCQRGKGGIGVAPVDSMDSRAPCRDSRKSSRASPKRPADEPLRRGCEDSPTLQQLRGFPSLGLCRRRNCTFSQVRNVIVLNDPLWSVAGRGYDGQLPWTDHRPLLASCSLRGDQRRCLGCGVHLLSPSRSRVCKSRGRRVSLGVCLVRGSRTAALRGAPGGYTASGK